MKKEIHPQYNTSIKATCACGHTFAFGSTIEKIEVEVCSQCHPFFTGEEKIIDTAGRVEKFKTRRVTGEKAKAVADKRAETKAKKEAEVEKEDEVEAEKKEEAKTRKKVIAK